MLIPLLVLEFAYIYALYGRDFLPPMHANTTPQEMAAFVQHQQEMTRHALETMRRYWYLFYPLGLLFGLIIYALFAGMSAFAYRALVTSEATTAQPLLE